MHFFFPFCLGQIQEAYRKICFPSEMNLQGEERWRVSCPNHCDMFLTTINRLSNGGDQTLTLEPNLAVELGIGNQGVSSRN